MKFFTSLLITKTLIFFSGSAYAQLQSRVNININENNQNGSALIVLSETDLLDFEVLQLNVYNADSTSKGRLYINENPNYIVLFPGAVAGNNGNNVDIDIPMTPQLKALFQPGNNILRFGLNSAGDYTIRYIRIKQAVTRKEYASIIPDINAPITENKKMALKMYKRIVGVRTPIDNPILDLMAGHIAAGAPEEAAKVAMSEPGFYNHVVRDLAAKMSTRDETVETRLNDFIATFIGVTRDETDARELLTGDFTYQGLQSSAPSLPIADLIESNNHYDVLEADNYDIATVLGRVDGQVIRNSAQAVVRNPDPAGLLTTRTFMGAHAIAGTNRRLVEYAMRIFTCNPIENYADATAPDIRVGRDIDRFPGGDGTKFQTTCKACHGIMDGFRGAFAKFDFENSFIKYGDLTNGAFSNNPNDTADVNRMKQDPIRIARKLNHNSEAFPYGHETVDDSWVNFATSPSNMRLFGWREPASGTSSSTQGSGVNSFGRAISNSKAFSSCMVKRVFTELCRREPAASEATLIENISQEFEAADYNLKHIFQKIISRPECIGR